MPAPATPKTSQPLYFGQGPRRLFGIYHPANPMRRDQALLVCAPFGNEDLCIYRTLRHLAQVTSGSGVPTLRFDYAGCGNSQDLESDTSRLDAWVDSIVDAVHTLQQLSGATRVTLLGVRLGALLACLAAPRCPGVVDLIAVAPIVSGRAYLRELKALQLAGQNGKGSARHSEQAADFLESGGFVISSSLQQALSAIDLSKLTQAPVATALLLDRDDLPGAGRLATRLQELGVQLEQGAITGYTAMMDDPHRCQTPTSLLDAVTNRLQKTSGLQPTEATPDPQPMQVEMGMLQDEVEVRETATYFGMDTPLFGIVSTPVQAAASDMGILMLNAGAIRLVGPNRMYVPMARHWAAQGHTVLRMDIAGLGDSPPRAGQPDNIVYSDLALNDVKAGIAYLRQQPGVRRVLVVGLCSGAYHAFKAAAKDLAIDTSVMINPLTFFWKEGMSLDPGTISEARIAQDLMRHRRVMFNAHTWRKVIKGGVSPTRLKQIVQQSATWISNNAYRKLAGPLHLPLKDDLPGELSTAAQRQVQLHFVFADHDPGLGLLKSYGGRRVNQLMRQHKLHIDMIADADHTFTNMAPRQALINKLYEIVDRL